MSSMIRILVASVVCAVILSGCAASVAGNHVAIAGQGMKSGSQEKTLTCGTEGTADGQIASGIQGQGEITVTVTDGNGATIYSNSFSGQGQEGETEPLSGAAGTWTLKATFRGGSFGSFGGGDFQGQWGITLSC